MAAMGGQLTTFVPADDGINCFMGNAYAIQSQTSGYLPWGPLLGFYQLDDAPFQHRRQGSVAGRMTQAAFRHVMSLVPYIPAARRGVATDLTAYRRFVDSYGTSNHG